MYEIVANGPPLVLIVDDELGPRDSIRLVLERRFRLMTAESGEQALDVLRHQRVDVVTLDLMMPGLGGIETFKKIREMDSDVEIIVVSAEGNSFAGLAHTLPNEAFAWIAKPFDTAQLIQAVEHAAERSRMRRAHDIRNPLYGVPGFVGNTHEAVTGAVNFLHAEENDGGSLQLHKTPVSLNQIVEQVMEGQAPRARLRRIELQADLDSGLPSVSLDIAMISRALTNLLDNALDYSPEWGVVRLETRRVGDDVVLRVRDYGPGIPADEIPQLFQRYGRGAKSASSSSTGVGLYVVRTIAEAHGGSISVTFPPNGGSTFVIVLPCAPHENA